MKVVKFIKASYQYLKAKREFEKLVKEITKEEDKQK